MVKIPFLISFLAHFLQSNDVMDLTGSFRSHPWSNLQIQYSSHPTTTCGLVMETNFMAAVLQRLFEKIASELRLRCGCPIFFCQRYRIVTSALQLSKRTLLICCGVPAWPDVLADLIILQDIFEATLLVRASGLLRKGSYCQVDKNGIQIPSTIPPSPSCLSALGYTFLWQVRLS